ncbi:MAG: hypothetical protein UT58_C0003G0028 [Microgenomates group bacterium GW2011_GWC1_39_7b]|uniref:Uncharacterized protein n=3 Tax=Candidatus Woeseibacteriota TaxID=1752722 RepID=A0A0G0LMD1_9BACT|nr:MAG: hypothetical protein UT17_C0003G0215 [Candidatus Woesebacteria bacterium GW2011_GWB1_39_10]KKR26950.1 MAG: hypothetical protein UT58_C0003G0028 [Microgenomates group bacterium GW2011_GWC1_39_7b]KKR72922.1 MAG: hypothetical protein UU16_C0035G0003 [Candidatus Woesebacteria bacterium GW2011_GWA2_40_7]KKS91152.1 MAG: hypothetical protein UV66_C0001G0509 [Candidatus Woesebacteria bacterium GW2011_GWA1_43_12]
MLLTNSYKLLAGANESSEIQNPIFGPGLQGVYSSGPTGFLSTFIPNFIGLVFVIGVLVFFFMLIWGAVQWISSGGDKQALESARGRITSAVIGIVILLGAFAVINVVETFFGLNILTIDIGPLVIQ